MSRFEQITTFRTLPSTGANNLIFGTDFCHSDPNAEIDGFDTLRNAPDISPAVKEGMIGKNASTLFEIAAR